MLTEIPRVASYGLFPTLISTFDLSKEASYDQMLETVHKTVTSKHELMKDSESTYDESMGNDWLDYPTIVDFKQHNKLETLKNDETSVNRYQQYATGGYSTGESPTRGCSGLS